MNSNWMFCILIFLLSCTKSTDKNNTELLERVINYNESTLMEDIIYNFSEKDSLTKTLYRFEIKSLKEQLNNCSGEVVLELFSSNEKTQNEIYSIFCFENNSDHKRFIQYILIKNGKVESPKALMKGDEIGFWL